MPCNLLHDPTGAKMCPTLHDTILNGAAWLGLWSSTGSLYGGLFQK